MEESTILKVASVLEAWNPLGEKANTIESLDGYRYEAIDIISTIGILTGQNKVERSIEQVLTQSFGIVLNKDALSKAAKDINHILIASVKE